MSNLSTNSFGHSSETTVGNTTTTPYRVLARKYRPQTLAELVGQDMLVKTLAHGLAANRLPHAFILHGIRGVGKTTTARILAKALNCVGPDGQGLPTANPCGVCASCIAITQDRHLDVVEMDAASRTGIDDIREVIEAARYKAVNGRYKIYIIDEVHMLSRSAFNALLKTLEEPPAHVKFIFATTELKKIPDTVLSRCMRFDLARITPQILFTHFQEIAAKEKISVEDEAMALIVRAADGSARDGLSLLDQAIALSDGQVTAIIVRDMLGLVDRGRLFTLIDALFRGDVMAALTQTRDLFAKGSDPVVMLQDLLDLIYWVTCLKSSPKLQHDVTCPAADRQQGGELAAKLSMPVLMRAWQVLSAGYEEVNRSPLPLQAMEMVLIRLCYLSDLPSAEDILATLQGRLPTPKIAAASPLISPLLPSPEDEPTASMILTAAPLTMNPPVRNIGESEKKSPLFPMPLGFQDLLTLLSDAKEPIIYSHVVHDVHLVDYTPGKMTVRLNEATSPQFIPQLQSTLSQLTGQPWEIILSDQAGAQTISDQKKAHQGQLIEDSKNNPIVQTLLENFPTATLTVKS